MNESKILGLLMAVVVGIIMLGSLLAPVVEDTTTTTGTMQNDGYYHMTKYDTTTDVTVEWDHTNPKVFTVNDEEYAMTLPFNLWVSVIVGDNWYLRYADGNTVQFTQTSYGGINYVSASTSDGKDLKVVCSNGTATITPYLEGVAQTSSTATYTEIYVLSGDTGDYVMKKSNATAYMGPDTPFVALGTTALDDGRCVVRIDGDISNGADVTIVASTTTTTTASDIEVNTTDIDKYIGYNLSTITFTITGDGTDYEVTYSYFVVPSEVTLELREHLDDGTNNLIQIIPIVAILALIMMLVGAVILRNRD